MLFPTVNFALFFFFIFGIAWLLKEQNTARKIFLLLASYFFYATWDPQFLGLLVGCTLANYGLGLWLSKTRKKGILIFGISVNLSVLGLFKYFNFFSSSLCNFLQALHIHVAPPLVELALPLGISFFTFQGISYIVDVYHGHLQAKKSPLDVLFFISFFPHLVSGPIVRASEFIPQLESPRELTSTKAHHALLLIAAGLIKKMIIANYLAIDLVDPVFEAPQKMGGLDAWLALYGYAMQIYCDFSAYSDMAIGFAALLGYTFPENFNQPYRSSSLQEFWKRWHISLSRWLRDYLYIPLGGSHEGKKKMVRNLILTMFLGGIWHGAAWTFVIWGLLHGCGLVVERLFKEKQTPPSTDPAASAFWSTVFTFHFVCFAWIFFRSDSLSSAGNFLECLFDFSRTNTRTTPFTVFLVALGASLHFLPTHGYEGFTRLMEKFPAPALGVVLGILIAILTALRPDEIAPFIYFRF